MVRTRSIGKIYLNYISDEKEVKSNYAFNGVKGVAVSGELLGYPRSEGSNGSVGMILDTDLMSDCDDVGWVVMLHTLADKGKGRNRGHGTSFSQ
jgi:hypothetical protein